MRIMYFGDGLWAQKALKKILGCSDIHVAGVVLRHGNKDLKLMEIAENNNIETYEFKDVNDENVIELFKTKEIDLGVSMSYDQVIGKVLRSVANIGFINCHAGKLPFYRGRNILNWALINDEKEIGITVHFIDDGIDTGGIICQAVMPIDDKDDYSTLLEKAENKCPQILFDSIRKIIENNYEIIRQDHIRGTYFSYRREGDEYIDWNWPSRRIFNLVRAITKPGPGAYTYYKGKKMFIWKASLINSCDYISTPGEIIGKLAQGGVVVKTGDNSILVERVSFENEEIMSEPKLRTGERLGINVPLRLMQLEERVKQLEERLSLNE